MVNTTRLKKADKSLREELTPTVTPKPDHSGAVLTLSPGDKVPDPLRCLGLLPKEVDPRETGEVVGQNQDIPVLPNYRSLIHRTCQIHVNKPKRGRSPRV
jgi:hypothetical protein